MRYTDHTETRASSSVGGSVLSFKATYYRTPEEIEADLVALFEVRLAHIAATQGQAAADRAFAGALEALAKRKGGG